MSHRFPEYLDPWQACGKEREFAGTYRLADLDRLTPLLASVEGEAAFALRFGHDDERRPTVTGHVDANLSLICQRCLQPMDLAVHSVVALSPVQGLEESTRLPELLDPLLVENHRVCLRDLVEDELIMALPSIPRHAASECRAAEDGNGGNETNGEDADNPFAVLAALKSSGNDSGSDETD